MEDKIQAFRQPMITATGIILGFILNFAATWVKNDSLLPDSLAYLVGLCVLLGTICLIVVLFRALNMAYPRANGEAYYARTHRMFILGLGLAFGGALVDMFANFMVE